MLLQACLNGNRLRKECASVPITHSEIVADAIAVVAAGANALHVHPRNPDGSETLHPDHVAACLQAIRAKVPNIPVGVATGTWISPGGRARHQHILEWNVVPDYASVNLSEEDAPEMMDLLLSKGIGIEAGIWSSKDAERFVALDRAKNCLRVLVEMITDDPQAAFEEHREVVRILGESDITLPILLHGEGGSAWAMVTEAAARGFSTRIGFEDTLTLPDGRPAPSNRALIAVAAQICAQN